MTALSIICFFQNLTNVSTWPLFLLLLAYPTFSRGMPFMDGNTNLQKIYDSDLFKDYQGASELSKLLDDYGASVALQNDMLTDKYGYLYNDDDTDSDDDTLDSLTRNVISEQYDNASGHQMDDKVVGARAKRMGFIFPFGYTRRFIRNYRARRIYPGGAPKKRRPAYTALRG